MANGEIENRESRRELKRKRKEKEVVLIEQGKKDRYIIAEIVGISVSLLDRDLEELKKEGRPSLPSQAELMEMRQKKEIEYCNEQGISNYSKIRQKLKEDLEIDVTNATIMNDIKMLEKQGKIKIEMNTRANTSQEKQRKKDEVERLVRTR